MLVNLPNVIPIKLSHLFVLYSQGIWQQFQNFHHDLRYHYVEVDYYITWLREWQMYASRKISFIFITISTSGVHYLPSGNLFEHPAPKHLKPPPLPVAFLFFLHQFCDMRRLHLVQLSECQRATSVYSHLKLRHVNFWAVEYYSYSGWCSVNVSTDDIITHSDSASIVGVLE